MKFLLLILRTAVRWITWELITGLTCRPDFPIDDEHVSQLTLPVKLRADHFTSLGYFQLLLLSRNIMTLQLPLLLSAN